jgi:hypothetical protein
MGCEDVSMPILLVTHWPKAMDLVDSGIHCKNGT